MLLATIASEAILRVNVVWIVLIGLVGGESCGGDVADINIKFKDSGMKEKLTITMRGPSCDMVWRWWNEGDDGSKINGGDINQRT